MSELLKCVVGALAATSPIWGACLIFAAAWLGKAFLRERRAWKAVCEDAAEYMNEHAEEEA